MRNILSSLLPITIHYTIKTKVKSKEKADDLLDIWKTQAEKSKTFAEVVSFDRDTDFPMKLCEIIGTEIKDYFPLEIAGFNLYLPYADCKVFQIYLNKYPTENKTFGDTYGWQSFCKTQFVWDRDKPERFLKCHLGIIAYLDYLNKYPEVDLEVYDEGDYWKSRSLNVLLQKTNASDLLMQEFRSLDTDEVRELLDILNNDYTDI